MRRSKYKEGSKEANALYTACEDEVQKKIVKVVFIEGYTAEAAEYIIGYSTRQIYRIMKGLKERAGL